MKFTGLSVTRFKPRSNTHQYGECSGNCCSQRRFPSPWSWCHNSCSAPASRWTFLAPKLRAGRGEVGPKESVHVHFVRSSC